MPHASTPATYLYMWQSTDKVHIFRVALAVVLGIATVLLMDATNTAFFGWYRWAFTTPQSSLHSVKRCAWCVAGPAQQCGPLITAVRLLGSLLWLLYWYLPPFHIVTPLMWGCSRLGHGTEMKRAKVRLDQAHTAPPCHADKMPGTSIGHWLGLPACCASSVGLLLKTTHSLHVCGIFQEVASA